MRLGADIVDDALGQPFLPLGGALRADRTVPVDRLDEGLWMDFPLTVAIAPEGVHPDGYQNPHLEVARIVH